MTQSAGPTRGRLESELADTMARMDEMNSLDVSLNETSVLNCGLMVKYWSIKLQMAELDLQSNNERRRSYGERLVESASKHLAEWEKRKAMAWEKRKLDELPRIARAIEEIQGASGILESLE